MKRAFERRSRAPATVGRRLACGALAVVALAAAPARADDRADLERTKIIGNRELPKVLYIVPWRKPLLGDLAGRPVHSIVDEALAPVDRDVFRREVRYDGQLQPAPAAGPGAASPPPGRPK